MFKNIINTSSKVFLLSLILMYSMGFLACKYKYFTSNTTFTCKLNGNKLLTNTINIEVYDESHNLVSKQTTNYDGEAMVVIPTEMNYYVEAYGMDNQRNKIKGDASFYLDSDNEYEFIEIPMKYVSSH